jgi:thioredoxin-like negative regulator of GroEL
VGFKKFLSVVTHSLMLVHLLALAAAFPDHPGHITQLTMENWDEIIDKRDPDAVWFVMFSGDPCPPCTFAAPIFEKAAAEADGMVNFGLVRTELDPGLSMRYQVRNLPTFMIVHRSGRVDYTGPRNDRSMVNAAAKLIPDRSIPVEFDWANDGRESVILFTDKKVTPPIWASVSCVYHGKVRVGISSDPDVMDLFKVDKTPTILFVNKSHTFTYYGRNSFLSLKQYIDDFLNGAYEEPFQLHPEFYMPDEYEYEAKNFTGYFIIQAWVDLDPKVKAAYQKFRSNRLKFFYGDRDLPLPFMKPGFVYILAPQRNMGIKLDSVDELVVTLTSVFDGTATWTPYDKLQ